MKTKIIIALLAACNVCAETQAVEVSPASAQYTAEEFLALPPPTGPGTLDADFGKFRQGEGPRQTITLTTGKVLKNARVKSATPLTVMIHHEGGLMTVDKTLLPPDLLELYPLPATAVFPEATLRSLRSLRATRYRETSWGRVGMDMTLDDKLNPKIGFFTFDNKPVFKMRANIEILAEDIPKFEEILSTYDRWTAQAIEKKVSVFERSMGEVSGVEFEYTFHEDRGAMLNPKFSIGFFFEEIVAMRVLIREDIEAVKAEFKDKLTRMQAASEIQ